MRSLKKNQEKIWYALYEKKVPIYAKDSDGNNIIDPYTGKFVETGDYEDEYSNPVPIEVSLSSGKGEAESQPFGVSIEYDRVISTTDLSLPIAETTLIWKETEPEFYADGKINKYSADYRVAAAPIKSLNSMLIAIKRNEKTVVLNG